MSSERKEADNDLVSQMAAATISGLEDDEKHKKSEDPDAPGLLSLPALPMKIILSLVASRTFNKPPIYHWGLQNRCSTSAARQERAEAEYSVKNLMSLRRVCTKFEEIVLNLSPLADFEPIDIDVKLLGSAGTRSVTFLKYGGTGSRMPATRLSRIRRFNEFNEHVENFERLKNIYIVNIPLTEELFETLGHLYLKNVEKISFEKIPEVKFAEHIHVPTYISQFLDSLETSPRVFFNSTVFNPNEVLFGGEPDDPMDLSVSDENHVSNIGIPLHRQFRSKYKMRATGGPANRFKNAVNIISNAMSGEAFIKDAIAPWKLEETRRTCKDRLNKMFYQRTQRKSGELRKSGKFHLRKLQVLLENRPAKSRHSILFHLKMLKKITGMNPIVTEDEKKIIENLEEAEVRHQFLTQYPFFNKYPKTRRAYVALE